MINITQSPFACTFSKNPVNFKVFASDFSAEIAVFPSITLSFQFELNNGMFFQFKFVNPTTAANETLTWIASSGASADGTHVPGNISFTVPATSSYVGTVAVFMQENTTLATFYNVIHDGLTIKLVAKEAVEELIPTDFYQNFIVLGSPPISGDISSSFWKPKKRNGHRINVNVYFEAEYLSNVFELVSEQYDTVNDEGTQDIEIASILDSEIKNSFDNPPLPDVTNPALLNITQKGKVLRRYFIEVSEQWQDMKQDVEWVKSDILFSHFGGVSMDDFSRDNPIYYLQSEKNALTWWIDKKRLYPTQNDWIHVMNVTTANEEFNTELVLLYKDLTTDTFSIGSQGLMPWETMTIPVGYKQLNVEGRQDPTKEVYGWRIIAKNTGGEIFMQRDFRLTQPQNFVTNTIVYLNSFGVAESFVCSGFFEKNLETTSDIGSKTLKHDYKSINGRDFVFNKNSKNSFKARTGVLKKAEANALKSMLNVAPVFLLENELLRPILIETGNFVTDDTSEITQIIDFKITKSMELTNVSEMITKPSLNISSNCGVFKGEVVSENEINIYGELTIYKDGVVVETLTHSTAYQSLQKVQEEGFYNFKCQVTIGLQTFDLSASFQMKKEVVQFDSPNHSGFGSFSICQMISSISDTVKFYSQDDDPMTVDLIPNYLIPVGGPVKLGVKRHRLEMNCFDNIYDFWISDQDYRNFDFHRMTNLRLMRVYNCNLPGHWSNAKFKNAEIFTFINNDLESFELGMNIHLQQLILENNSMDADAIEELFIELWTYRKLFLKDVLPVVIVTLTGNPGTTSLSANALAIKNGTGIYAGDGLIQNQINIIY